MFFFLKKKKKIDSWGDVLARKYTPNSFSSFFLSKHLQTRTVQKLWKKLSDVEMAPEMAQVQEEVWVFCFFLFVL